MDSVVRVIEKRKPELAKKTYIGANTGTMENRFTWKSMENTEAEPTMFTYFADKGELVAVITGDVVKKIPLATVSTPDQEKQPPTVATTTPEPTPPESKVRTFTDATGKFKIEALFLGFKDGVVKLERADNKQFIELPLEKLSEPDQKWVTSQKAE